MNIPYLSLPLLQVVSEVSQTNSMAAAQLSVWDLALKGGWIMLILLLLSILAIYLFTVKFLEIRRAGKKRRFFYGSHKGLYTDG